jgi:hypothetical protein
MRAGFNARIASLFLLPGRKTVSFGLGYDAPVGPIVTFVGATQPLPDAPDLRGTPFVSPKIVSATWDGSDVEAQDPGSHPSEDGNTDWW